MLLKSYHYRVYYCLANCRFNFSATLVWGALCRAHCLSQVMLTILCGCLILLFYVSVIFYCSGNCLFLVKVSNDCVK